MRQYNNNQHGIGSIKPPNGKLVQDDADKAEVLNTYFHSVFIHKKIQQIFQPISIKQNIRSP